MGMIIALLTAILLVYMLLAAVLENAVQPIFIITTVPPSLIGVIFCLSCYRYDAGHYLHDRDNHARMNPLFLKPVARFFPVIPQSLPDGP
jgi:hypothetical protein